MNIPPPPKPKPAANPPGGTLLYGPPPPRQNPPQEKRKNDDEVPPPQPTFKVGYDAKLTEWPEWLEDDWSMFGGILVVAACVFGILLDAALLYAKWTGRF